MRALAPLVLALAACEGTTGTVQVVLATAPGSTVLDNAQTLRMQITNPREVVTAERAGDGFELALDIPAGETSAAILVDALDASGNLVANGATPEFVFAGISGRVVVYMAEPDSVGVAPEVLSVARSEVGGAALPYGAIFVGGRVAGGAASDAVEVYNTYDHRVTAGLVLPGARSGPAVAFSQTGIHIFGGLDEGGAARSTLWSFNPSVAPAGAYIEIGDKPGFARSGERFVPVGNEQFLLTGMPAAELFALDGSLRERSGIEALPTAGTTITANDGTQTSIFVGAAGVVRYRNGQFDALAVAGRADAEVAGVGGGKVAVVCGAADALRIDASSGSAESIPGIPSVVKSGCAVASTGRHLLIAGGTSASGIDATVEVFDVGTLERVVTATLAVPRTDAVALPLPNDQILIAGGVDASGAPVAALELFTPLTAR